MDMGTPAVMTYTEKACNVRLLHDSPSYQPTAAVLSGTEASNVTQLQENPSYLPITVDSAGTDASNMMLFEENPSYSYHINPFSSQHKLMEHEFVNSLYNSYVFAHRYTFCFHF